MFFVKTPLKYSEIHGLACFAGEDIKKGQTVWRFDPGIDVVFKAGEELTCNYNQFDKDASYKLGK